MPVGRSNIVDVFAEVGGERWIYDAVIFLYTRDVLLVLFIKSPLFFYYELYQLLPHGLNNPSPIPIVALAEKSQAGVPSCA